jgi:zinc-ribbon domain
MFCSSCGKRVEDGDRFCKNCGASLQTPDGVLQHLPDRSQPRMPSASKAPVGRAKNPYKDQIAQLRLQLKELRINLKQVNNQISGTRSNYFEVDSFAQRGLVQRVGRMIEGAQLFGPNQQKKQLQDQIVQVEQELLSLERAQEEWKLQQ